MTIRPSAGIMVPSSTWRISPRNNLGGPRFPQESWENDQHAKSGDQPGQCYCTSITENDSLQRARVFLQLVDDRTSLELLDETDDSVEQKKTTDDTEIDPVLKTGSTGSGVSMRRAPIHMGATYRTAAA